MDVRDFFRREKMNRISGLLVLAFAFFISLSTQANVSLRNGNFFIGYSDIAYPGGFETKIERVYNSKTPYNGWFGWGWGSEYEVFLSISADGSVLVHEYGGGAQNRFNPQNFTTQELEQAVNTIASAAQKAGVIGSASQFAAYKEKLKNDATFRNDEWQKFRAQGKVAARSLPVGTKLTSTRFSFQMIQVVQNGYQRIYDSGKVETFDATGRLVKVQDRNGHSIQISRSKDGLIEKIQDNFNRKIFFTFNKKRKVEKLQGENNKTVVYQYNDQDELVYTKDADGNIYTYGYSKDRRHNLTEVGYSDKSKMLISYYGKDQFENVKSVKDRDGTLTEYSYGKVNNDPKSLKVTVVVKNNEGKALSTSVYDYNFKIKATGEEWTQKMVTTVDGDRTETVYDEKLGLPLFIKRGKDETTFVYDARGRVTKKTTPFEVTELSYDPKVGKVSKVVKIDRANKNAKPEWSQFQYDDRANLISAVNSDKQSVKLFYDTNGRISSMIDQNKKRIDFKYNENSKPVEIIDPSLGSIKVTYTNSGEVKKVDSAGGRKIALQVTSAFQNLLEIIRPAGVTLSF